MLQDIRFALRLIAGNPGFAIVVVLILGLGIGASSMLFSFVSCLMIRPLAMEDPARTIAIFEHQPSGERPKVSLPNFLDWRAQNKTFASMALYRTDNFNYADGADPDRVLALRAGADIFAVLGAKTAYGRVFDAHDDRPGADRVAVLTKQFWKLRYQSDPNLVGRTVRINGEPHVIIGVLKEDPDYFGMRNVWVPLAMDEKAAPRGSHFLSAVGRLRPDVTVAMAQADLDTIARRLEKDHIENRNLGVLLMRFHDYLLESVRSAMLVCMAASCFLLLITCINVANIVLARGAARRKELAIRASVGASRPRIIRQLVTESIVLSVLGGVLGLLIAYWTIDPVANIAPVAFHIIPVEIDGRVLAFTFAVSILTGIVFGMTPALQIARSDLQETLKSGGKLSGSGSGRVRQTLVVAEVALAVVLLVGAALLIQSYKRVQNVDPGLDPKNVIAMQVSLPPSQYPQRADIRRFMDRAIEDIRGLPGVESASTVFMIPIGPANLTGVTVEGLPTAVPGETHGMADYEAIGPGYFHTLRIPIVQGRDFSDHDTENSPRVIIVGESVARRFWPGQDAIGRRVKIGPPGSDGPWLAIVGVVKDVKNRGLDSEPPAEVYVPFRQEPNRTMSIVVRSTVDPLSIASTVRRKILAIDPDQPVFNMRTMREIIDESLWQRRGLAVIIGVFAVVSLLLSALGIHGVISYSVHQRQHELGVRVALGALAGDVLRLVLQEGFALTAIGLVIGVGAALSLTRAMSALLFAVSAADLSTYVAIGLLLVIVSFAACFIPARRATNVDPLIALRHE